MSISGQIYEIPSCRSDQKFLTDITAIVFQSVDSVKLWFRVTEILAKFFITEI